jgi:hypothetical protein
VTDRFNWGEYRPSKALWFWSCVGCIIATLVIGFTWGGWVTEGTANRMVAEAEDDGRAVLAAAVCVNRFLGASDAASKLAELKAENSWQRDNYIEAGGWTTFERVEEPIKGAAERCASQLAEMDLPAVDSVAGGAADTTVN